MHTIHAPDHDSVPSLDRFVALTREAGKSEGRFGSESERTVRIDIDGGVWLKPGAAIAYRGDLTFERRPTLAARSLKDAAVREAAPLVRAAGKGRLYAGDRGLHVRLLRLRDEALFVAWADLLAFEESLAFEATLVGRGIGLAAGGLAALRLSGDGTFAIATHGQPLTLIVTPGAPVSTDPHATLAWSANLEPSLKTGLSWRSVFAHGGSEPVQMLFEGSGFVVVQPYKDPSRIKPNGRALKRLASLAGV